MYEVYTVFYFFIILHNTESSKKKKKKRMRSLKSAVHDIIQICIFVMQAPKVFGST